MPLPADREEERVTSPALSDSSAASGSSRLWIQAFRNASSPYLSRPEAGSEIYIHHLPRCRAMR